MQLENIGLKNGLKGRVIFSKMEGTNVFHNESANINSHDFPNPCKVIQIII